MLVFYFIVLVFIYKKKVFLIFLFAFLAFSLNINYRQDIPEDKWHTGVVKKVYSSSVLVEEEGQLYYLMKIEEDLMVGDVVAYGCYYKTDIDPGSFDVFYRSTGASAYGYVFWSEVQEEANSIRANLYRNLMETNNKYADFALAMLFKQETTSNSYLFNMSSKMGISHLLVISGFHISIFYIIMHKMLKKVVKDSRIIESISFGVILFFLYLVYFPLTGIRALFTLLIIRYGKWNRIDSLSIVAIIFFIMNPWVMFTSAMILSFSITLMIYCLRTNRKSFLDTVLIASLSFYVAIPTLATWQSSVNLFAPLLNIVWTPFISLEYIICLVCLPFRFLWPFASILFSLFKIVMSLFSILYYKITIVNPFTFYQQIYMTFITILFISQLKEHKVILLNTFLTTTILFIII